jgi:hypothetical protein
MNRDELAALQLVNGDTVFLVPKQLKVFEQNDFSI